MNRIYLLTIFLNLFFISANADPGDTTITKKKYYTNRLTNLSVTFDGIPNEEAWNTVEWGGDFTQWQPNEGKAPSHPTRFKIMYDNKFLYVAYDCFDSAPDSIGRRMEGVTSSQAIGWK